MTAEAYDGVAERYARMFSGELARRPLDRALLGAFAELVRSQAAAAGAPAAAADPGVGVPQWHPHLVTPLHRWPPEAIIALLGRAGFVASARLLRDPDATERLPSAVLLAHRPAPTAVPT